MALDWGFQAGKREAEDHSARLSKLAADERAVDLGNKKAEIELSQNEAFLRAIQDGGMDSQVGQAANPAQALGNLGTIAINTGNIEKGRELLSASSTIANQTSLARRREAKTNFENLTTLSNLYQGVETPQQWKAANDQFALMTGQPSPFANQPFSTAMLDNVRKATVTAKDAAGMEVTKARQELLGSQLQTDEQRRKLLTAQEEYTRTREAALKKSGGKPVPQQYVTAVSNELRNHLEDIGDDGGRLNGISLPYAEQVQSLVMNDGLTLSQAVTNVVNTALASGELSAWTVQRPGRPGTSRTNPTDMPMNKEGAIDTGKIKPNRYYKTPDGGAVFVTPEGKFMYYEPGETLEEAGDGVDLEDEELEEEE